MKMTPSITKRKPGATAAKRSRKLRAHWSEIVSRAQLGSFLGQSFDGDRDLYAACGYPTNITYQEYLGMFVRGGISRRVVDAYPRATWRQFPEVYDTEDEASTSAFEKAWKTLVRDSDIFSYLRRADILAGVGRYSVLLLGYGDARPLDQPVQKAAKLLYLQPLGEGDAPIATFEEDPKNERYGLPKTYNLNLRIGDNKSSISKPVHFSRVLHVTDERMTSDIYGTPRMESVYNYLVDIAKIGGGSAEMFWRAGFPGLALQTDPETALTDEAEAEMEEQLTEYVHKLRRTLLLQGVEAKELAGSPSDPSGHSSLQLRLISGTTGIPERILTGSERGELASTQDRDNWADRVDERRLQIAEPFLRDFVDAMIATGVLPAPKSGEYLVAWPEIRATTPKEKADLNLVRLQTAAAYVAAPGLEILLPPEQFLTRYMDMTPEEAAGVMEDYEEEMDAQAALEEEARKAAEAEAAKGVPGTKEEEPAPGTPPPPAPPRRRRAE